MRTITTLIFIFILTALQAQNFIHVDQFGYLPSISKVAVIANPQMGYNANESYTPSDILEVRHADTDEVVLFGAPVLFANGATDNDSGDKGWWFDFSPLNTPGDYYIHDVENDVSSHIFEIKNDVYNDVFKAAGRMFFYNRCNEAKPAPYAASGWTDEPAFLNPLQDAQCRYIYDQTNASLEKDLTGGWFDAGDYNKYVTFAHQAVSDLLWSYRENPQAYGDNWNIPESGNGIPDVLDELKVELDWLMKMNNPDGSTIIKMGSRNYSENISAPPSANIDGRYYGPSCSSAAIAAVGMFAHAADIYATFPEFGDYAAELESRAITTWDYVLPLLEGDNLDENCDDGSIIAGDADLSSIEQKQDALVAVIHLFALTGNTVYEEYFTQNILDAEQFNNNFWGVYLMPLNDALLHYTTLDNVNETVKSQIINSFTADVNQNGSGYYGFNESDLYRAFMPSWSYHWGSNLPKARYGIINSLVNRYGIDLPNSVNYTNYMTAAIHYFHGQNPNDLVYLSNMLDYGAEKSCNEIYHTWFADGTDWDNAETSAIGPAPGFVSGGANGDFSVSTISPPAGQPLQKSYLDFNTGYPDNSWEITEPSISYQAGYLRFLANFVQADAPSSVLQVEVKNDLKVSPNPVQTTLQLQELPAPCQIEIIDISGRIVFSGLTNGVNYQVDMSDLVEGIYLVKATNQEMKIALSAKVVKVGE
ncbi:MAG: endoglucanase [Saprospiraceae bacterium]|jgi:endoglucanase